MKKQLINEVQEQIKRLIDVLAEVGQTNGELTNDAMKIELTTCLTGTEIFNIQIQKNGYPVIDRFHKYYLKQEIHVGEYFAVDREDLLYKLEAINSNSCHFSLQPVLSMAKPAKTKFKMKLRVEINSIVINKKYGIHFLINKPYADEPYFCLIKVDNERVEYFNNLESLVNPASLN